MTPYQNVLASLKNAEKSKAQIINATGEPYFVVCRVLSVLVLEGKVVRQGLRYKLKEKRNEDFLVERRVGVWGVSPTPR